MFESMMDPLNITLRFHLKISMVEIVFQIFAS